MNKLSFKLLALVTVFSLFGAYPASLLAIRGGEEMHGGMHNQDFNRGYEGHTDANRYGDDRAVAPGAAATYGATRGFEEGAAANSANQGSSTVVVPYDTTNPNTDPFAAPQ